MFTNLSYINMKTIGLIMLLAFTSNVIVRNKIYYDFTWRKKTKEKKKPSIEALPEELYLIFQYPCSEELTPSLNNQFANYQLPFLPGILPESEFLY